MSTHQHNVDIIVSEAHPHGIVYHAGTAQVFPNVAGVSIQLTPEGIPSAQLDLREIGLDLKEVKARAGVRVGGNDYVLIDPDTIVFNDLPSDEVIVMRGLGKPAAAALTACLVKEGFVAEELTQRCHDHIVEFYKAVLTR